MLFRSPGGAQCTAGPEETSCTISGLTNRTLHTFTVVARNDYGDSDPVTSEPVLPLAPGLQAWAAPVMVNPGATGQIFIGNAPAGSTVKVTAPGMTSTVTVNAAGYAVLSGRSSKPGITTYVLRAGKATVSTAVYAPQVVLPNGSARWGSQMRFSAKYLPAGTEVTFTVGGSSLVAVANSKGVATASFLARNKGETTFLVAAVDTVLAAGALTVK